MGDFMDLIALALAKRYTDKKAVCNVDIEKYGYAAGEDMTGKISVEVADSVLYVKISDNTPDLLGAVCIVRNDTEVLIEEIITEDAIVTVDGLAFYDDCAIVCTVAGVEFNGVAYPETGTYVPHPQMFGSESVSYTVSKETIHPIDPKYIPDLDSITLNSPSGKRFTVTVDDSGTITATEA